MDPRIEEQIKEIWGTLEEYLIIVINQQMNDITSHLFDHYKTQ